MDWALTISLALGVLSLGAIGFAFLDVRYANRLRADARVSLADAIKCRDENMGMLQQALEQTTYAEQQKAAAEVIRANASTLWTQAVLVRHETAKLQVLWSSKGKDN